MSKSYSKSFQDSRYEDSLVRKSGYTQMNPKKKYVTLCILSLCLTLMNSLAISKVKQSTKQHPLDVLYLKLLLLLCFLVELLFCLNINGVGLMEEKWKKKRKRKNGCSLNLVIQGWMLLNHYYLPVPAPAEGYCCGQVSLMQKLNRQYLHVFLFGCKRQIGVGCPLTIAFRTFWSEKPRKIKMHFYWGSFKGVTYHRT